MVAMSLVHVALTTYFYNTAVPESTQLLITIHCYCGLSSLICMKICEYHVCSDECNHLTNVMLWFYKTSEMNELCM